MSEWEDSTVTSNVLRFVVNNDLVVAVNGGSVYVYPNPVQSVLTIDSLSLSEGWESASITGINGSEDNLQEINLSGQTRVSVHVEKLEKGMYIIQLRRRDGGSKIIKFVKI